MIDKASTARATFVLVHGGWCGGWCYAEVAERLRAKGHRVFTPTLTGLGERSHLAGPGVNLSTHIQDVVNVIEWEELDDVVLCGHSYGGMVIAGVSDRLPDRVASVVYLDAFLPEDGTVLGTYADPEFGEFAKTMKDRGEHSMPMPPPMIEALQLEAVASKLTPHPIDSVLESIHLTGAYLKIRKKTYVHATKNPLPHLKPSYAKAAADPSWTVITVPANHTLMLEAPERCVEILEQAI